MVAEAIARGAIYAGAGADGLFVPGLAKDVEIATIVAGATVPLNVMAWKGLADAAELGKLGVHRLSAGSGIAQMLWAQAEALGKEFLANGRSQPFDEGTKPYPQIQALFT
jgi:2-methylisocitrate lyase-like PEP mutase family enzyme